MKITFVSDFTFLHKELYFRCILTKTLLKTKIFSFRSIHVYDPWETFCGGMHFPGKSVSFPILRISLPICCSALTQSCLSTLLRDAPALLQFLFLGHTPRSVRTCKQIRFKARVQVQPADDKVIRKTGVLLLDALVEPFGLPDGAGGLRRGATAARSPAGLAFEAIGFLLAHVWPIFREGDCTIYQLHFGNFGEWNSIFACFARCVGFDIFYYLQFSRNHFFFTELWHWRAHLIHKTLDQIGWGGEGRLG